MQKLDYAHLIIESEPQLQQLERRQTQARLRDYVRFLSHLKAGRATTQCHHPVSSGGTGRFG